MAELNKWKREFSSRTAADSSSAGSHASLTAARSASPSVAKLARRVPVNLSSAGSLRLRARGGLRVSGDVSLRVSGDLDALKRRSIQDATAILAGGSLLPAKPHSKPWQQSRLMARETPSPWPNLPRETPSPWPILTAETPIDRRSHAVKFAAAAMTPAYFAETPLPPRDTETPLPPRETETPLAGPDVFTVEDAGQLTVSRVSVSRPASLLDRGRRKSPRSPSPSACLSRTPSQSSASPRPSESFLLSPARSPSPDESQTTCAPGETPRPETETETPLPRETGARLLALSARPHSWFAANFSPSEQRLLLGLCGAASPSPTEPPDDRQLVRVSVRLRGGPPVSVSDSVLTPLRPVSQQYHRSLQMPASLAPGDAGFFHMDFNHVLGPDTQQRQVFETVARPYLEETVSRFRHGVIMTYGQTGTGKTYTLEGELPDPRRSASVLRAPAVSLPEEAGIIPRTFWWVFNEPLSFQLREAFHPYFPKIHEDATLEHLVDVKMSVLEIYMEQPRDLLTGSDKVKLRETPSGDLFWESLSEESVGTYGNAMACFSRARQFRKIGETMVNRKSSRSHVIVTLTLRIKAPLFKCRLDFSSLTVKLHLLDLAGNEKLSKSQVTGIGLQELKKINQSLSTLAFVMQTLSKYFTPKRPVAPKDSTVQTGNERQPEKLQTSRSAIVKVNPHVPYRNSLLTRSLQQSLSGDNPVVLMCTVSSHRRDYLESLATLRFAQQCQNIALMPKHSTASLSPNIGTDQGFRECVLKLVDTVLRMEKSNASLRRKMKNCKLCKKGVEESNRT